MQIQDVTVPKNLHSVSESVFAELLDLLKGKTIAKKERNSDQVAAYRLKNKRCCTVDSVVNPLTGKREERIMIGRTILLKQGEVQSCIRLYYAKYKGIGARKLYRCVVEKFCGVSEREIQTFINNQEKAQRMNPTFKNKAQITPVKSSRVMNQVQIDLVDMQKYPVSKEGTTSHYKYILVVLDVFSRYLFLRPLTSKSSAEVAANLLQLFSDIGPPLRIQCDQGKEFKGVVSYIMKSLGVQIINSSPYHPQSHNEQNNMITSNNLLY